MPTATASRPERTRWALLCAALAACSTAGTGDGDAGTEDPGNCVVADNAHGAASAAAVTPGTAATGQICVRGSESWFAIEVPAGNDLLDVTVGYPSSLTKVAVAAQLFAADGKTPIDAGSVADTRTGTRKGTISSTLRIPAPGKYLMVVRDGAMTASDTLNSFVLQIGFGKDPDSHEPNDALAQAKAPDGQPGWLAYRGDRDLYTVAVPANNPLLQVKIDNPAASQTLLHYALEDAKGTILGEGDVAPAAMPLDVLRLLPSRAAATYIVAISAGGDAPPDRRAPSGYTITLAARPELDPNEQGGRNDSGATATCLGTVNGNGSCGASYGGGEVTWHGVGQIGSLGDRDYFRFDSAAAPAVIELTAKIGNSPTQLALDLLVPEPISPCKADSECAAVNLACNDDSDCELSHVCLPSGTYTFCPQGQPCRLCAGAGACVPLAAAGGPTVCAQPQFLVHDTMSTHALHTAQPLLTTGPIYVVVHDFQDDVFDYGDGYTLDVHAFAEPDPGDQSPTPAMRNNFYNPYPMQNTDVGPNLRRARDITAEVLAGTPVTGYISYSSDDDWFRFQHPCPKADCGLVWEWTQPGPSPMRLAFLMRRDDTGIHESWTYLGQTPTSDLMAPVTGTFGDGDCHQCSFASKSYDGAYYYVQLRAVGAQAFDATPGGLYSFRMKTINPGCPASCSEAGTCGCYCKALSMCPPGPQL